MLRFAALFLCLIPFTMLSQSTTGQTLIRMKTSYGDIDVLLFDQTAPKTVANFLSYMRKGAYNNSIFHRLVTDFIVQAGGFQRVNNAVVTTAQDPAVVNEFGASNVRGTIAMAKTDGNPNSATNQWFFNLSDTNASNLNFQNGGFTVFGRIANSASFDVLNRLVATPISNQSSVNGAFNEIPLRNYTSGTPTDANYVLVESVSQLQTIEPPKITSGGIVGASAFGGYNYIAGGSFLEIYGENLAGTTREWALEDFGLGINAPTVLDGVSVSVNGLRAFVRYVSPNQVNVQTSAFISGSGSATVLLTYNGQSASVSGAIPMRLTAGGILAPPQFKVGDRQYAAALRPNGTFVAGSNIPGVPAAPARAGETLIFYGSGFGAVSPFTTPVAGQIASGLSSLSTPVQFLIGGVVARVEYAGLAPGFVGLYQFNVVVPQGVAAGDVRLEVTQGGTAIGQTLFLAVQ
jgi:uncharacterized protein (TIGR03437 family)